jgi:hypothetical protein
VVIGGLVEQRARLWAQVERAGEIVASVAHPDDRTATAWPPIERFNAPSSVYVRSLVKPTLIGGLPHHTSKAG